MKSAIVFVVMGKRFEFELGDVEAMIMLAAHRLGSESKVADELGVSRMAVSKWKHGASVPGDDNFKRLARLASASKKAA